MSRDGSSPGIRDRDDGKASASFSGRTAARGVRWTLAAVLARQGFQVLAAVVLARILGPDSYGIISAATIFTTFAALFLDQGLSAAIVQRSSITRRAAGATATLNLVVAVGIGAVMVMLAPAIADFFKAVDLIALLLPLALAIPLKGLAITPRAMLSRELQLHYVAKADIAGAILGAAAGISAALLGAGYFALAYQVIITDIVTAVLLLVAAKGPWPNHHLGELRPLLAFSLSVFFNNFLAYFSRNIDNVLVGRFLGLASLSLYGMAYRIMVLPIQLLGQTVSRVMFPAFSRASQDPRAVAHQLVTATRIMAFSAVPLMAYVGCAAPSLVDSVLGEAWLPAVPIISVLAVGGARETVFYITPSLMKGLGKGALLVRYEILAALVQVGGIVVGLQFGLLGVALGLVGAGMLLVPVLLVIQSRLTGLRIREQLSAIWPPLHASLWAGAGCLGINLLALPSLAIAALGLVVFVAVLGTVLVLCHKRQLTKFLGHLGSLVRRNPQTLAMATGPQKQEVGHDPGD
jgi:PST family polysaccharide transporter